MGGVGGSAAVTQNRINFSRLANVHNQFFLIQKFADFKHKLATKYRNWFSYYYSSSSWYYFLVVGVVVAVFCGEW